MKKEWKIIMGAIIIILIFVVGIIILGRDKRNGDTNNYREENEYVEIVKLPREYTKENAIKDNCIVSIGSSQLYNKDELDKFIDSINKNIEDEIRVIKYTTEGDMIIIDVIYKRNNIFDVCIDNTRDAFASDANYLYVRFSNIEIQEKDDIIKIYLKNSVEGELEELYLLQYNKKAEFIN